MIGTIRSGAAARSGARRGLSVSPVVVLAAALCAALALVPLGYLLKETFVADGHLQRSTRSTTRTASRAS